jgi:hypothetical protein
MRESEAWRSIWCTLTHGTQCGAGHPRGYLTGPRGSGSSAASHLLRTVVRAAPGTAGEETDLDRTVSTAVVLGAGPAPSGRTQVTIGKYLIYAGSLTPHRRARADPVVPAAADHHDRPGHRPAHARSHRFLPVLGTAERCGYPLLFRG